MFNLAICDDDINEINHIKNILNDTVDTEYRIYEFNSGDELLDYIKDNNETFNILLLDIEMPGRNGIEVKNLLEECNQIQKVIFVSTHIEDMQKAFGTKVTGFINKPIDPEILRKSITTILQKYQSTKTITIEGIGTINESNIKYIQADDTYTYVFDSNNNCSLAIRKSITNWEQELNSCFIRVHRSFLINLEYVTSISYTSVEITNKISIPVGRKYYNALKDGYQKFLVKQIKGNIGW